MSTTEALQRVLDAGSALSNCAFNLAQRGGEALSERDTASLDASRKTWDTARAALAATSAPAEPHADLTIDGYKGEKQLRWYVAELHRVRFVNHWLADAYCNALFAEYEAQQRGAGKDEEDARINANNKIAGLANASKKRSDERWKVTGQEETSATLAAIATSAPSEPAEPVTLGPNAEALIKSVIPKPTEGQRLAQAAAMGRIRDIPLAGVAKPEAPAVRIFDRQGEAAWAP